MMSRVIEKSAEIPEGSNVGSNLYDPTKPNSALFCGNKSVLGIPDGPKLVRKSYT